MFVLNIDDYDTVATLIVLLSFKILEDKHCLGVGGFDRAIIWHILHCYFVLILATYRAKYCDVAHISYLYEL